MTLDAGHQVGPYEIVSLLGRGGMGAVYLARDRRLHRRVALKFFRPEAAAADPERWRARLLHEARAASALNHPNICQVYDVGGEDPESWIAMEYVDGQSLRAAIGGHGLQPETVLAVARQIADALDHAHARGILHRDLKSDNVVREATGRIKVLDFGIAAPTPQAVAEEVTRTGALDEPGVLEGTLPYMAPEILRGEPACERTDLWSLGVVMYEMLTGSLPFKGGNSFETASAILEGRAAALPSRVSPAVAAIVWRLLARDPQARYRTASEVSVALEALERSRPPRNPSRRAVAAVVLLLVAALAAVGIWRVRRFSPLEVSGQRLVSTMAGAYRAPAYDPDGRRLAFVSPDAAGVPQIWVRDLQEDAAIQVTSGPQGASRPRWTPAGDRIVFARSGEGIWSVSPLGGTPTRIVASGSNPNLSRDGARLVFEQERTLWTANADGSDVRQVVGTPPVFYSIPMGPAFSPDGTTIAFFRPEAGPNGDLWVIPAEGGEARPLTSDLREGGWPVWTPDGHAIVFSSARAGSRTIWQIPAEGGEPVPLTTGAGQDDQPDITSDGRQLAYTNVRQTWELKRRDLASGSERTLLTRGLEILFPMFSPDGSRLTFFGRADRAVAIFTIGADGADLRQLTGGRELNHQPRWGSDGHEIYFFQVAPDPSFRRVPEVGGPSVAFREWLWETHTAPLFAPGGRLIVYVRRPARGAGAEESARTVVHEVASGTERSWPAPVTYVSGWSADSHQVVGWRGDGTIVRCQVADGSCTVLASGEQPVWPAGSDRIYFRRSPTPSSVELWAIGADGGPETFVANLGSFRPIDRFFDVSRDGILVWAPFHEGDPQLWSAALR